MFISVAMLVDILLASIGAGCPDNNALIDFG